MKKLLLLVLLAFTIPAQAHVGNKDVYQTVSSGPYTLFVTIRMPNVIPGVAIVEARSTGAPVTAIHITPMPLTGEASKHPPTADAMHPSTADAAFYTGSIWMMATGSWQVRFDIDGPSGPRTTAIPVPAVAVATLRMQRNLGLILAILGLFLIIGMAGIVGAAVRESRLLPTLAASPARRRMALAATAITLVVMGLAVWGGAHWWNVEAAGYAAGVYRPLEVHPTLNGNLLDLRLLPFHNDRTSDEDARFNRSTTDLLPDHGHLMHLYAIRQPGMDVVLHLHPNLVSPGDLRIALPAMPPGRYLLYGDIVHANGFPETVVTSLNIPANMPAATPAGPDDAPGPDDTIAQPPAIAPDLLSDTYKLPDGYTMVWTRPATLAANTAYLFRFRLLKPDGSPATDVQPYMGMAGHAAFVRTDGKVFAHTHPEGSAAMAAMTLANQPLANSNTPSAPTTGNDTMPDMPGMNMPAKPLPADVEFPYGFPTPGRYRIFIQMKHNTTIETGTFDTLVK